MGRRSLRASSQGIQAIKKALKLKKWSQTYIAGAVDCSRQTIWSLLQGKPTDCDVFMEVCTQLGLNWEEIAEPEMPEPEQNDSQDINALVREVRSRCCEAILENYSKIRLPDDTRIDVGLLYVDVYVLEKLSSKRYASISGLLEGVEQREDYERLALGQRQKRLPGQEIVQEFPRLMVLGKPGSGKTTFLRHLAVDCSKEKFFCDRIPVLIELRSIKEANSFNVLNLIHREFGLAQQEQTQQILNQGKAFILLDGLDEVPSQLRQSVRDQIYEFVKEYRKNRFVLTCRTQTIEYIADHFEPIEVANFDAQQVKIFARNWFTATPETSGEAEGWTSRFVEKLEENKQIRELAVTPILLTLTCLLFTAEQDLPTKRSQLYEKGSNLLLKQWDRFREIPRDYQQLSVSDKQKLLSYLAFRKFEQPDNFILFEQNEIQEYIAEHLRIDAEESEAFLKAIEAHHGLLIERANGIWSFSHLTFQEYFAAKHIVDSPIPEAAFHNLVIHITESRWREVFLVIVETLPSPDVLLESIKSYIDTLLIGDEKYQDLLRWVQRKSIAEFVSCQEVQRRCFYMDIIHQYEVERSLVLDCKVISYLYLYSCLNQKDNQLIDSAFILDHSLYWSLAYVRVVYSLISFNEDYDIKKLKFAINKAVNSCRVLLANKKHIKRLISNNFYDLLLELWHKLLSFDHSTDALTDWWQVNGQAWTEQLRVVMEYRHIRHDWQFSEEQKERLKQYYDANKLLVDCLNSDCYVSREVRQEIEETLLLPIAEIKKRQQ